MSNAETVARKLAQQSTVNSEAAIFVRMEDGLAVVNIGTSTIAAPCQGFNPPLAGMAVRVQWVNGSPVVTAPSRPQSPLGVITAAGTPRATVEVDGVSYMMPVMASYTPTNDDTVIVDWAVPGGMIIGAVAAVDQPETPGESGAGNTPFDVVVRAENSGRYQAGSGWWSNWPRASVRNAGIWVYGNRLRDAVGSGTVTRAEIYFPLEQQVGVASIGVHDHPSIPGGAPSITSKTNLPIGSRSGWQVLPDGYGTYLAAGGRGIGVSDGGDSIWRGTQADGLSGAIRLVGTR